MSVAPVLIKPDTRITLERPPAWELFNATENLIVMYAMQWKKVPRYLYINTTLWREVEDWMTQLCEDYALTPIPIADFPYGRVTVHSDYVKPRDLLEHHLKYTDEEAEDSGLLVIT